MNTDVRSKFQDAGNERSVLACVIQQPDLIVEVELKLSEDAFLTSHNRALYSILKFLFDKGAKSFDLMMMLEEAERKKVLQDVDREGYIRSLYETPVDFRNLDVYIQFVLDASIKYKLYRESQNIQDEVIRNVGHSDTALSSEVLVSVAESRILDISNEMRCVEDAKNMADGLAERLEFFKNNQSEIRGLTSGIKDRMGTSFLDKSIGGFTAGTLSIVAARMKVGKSTLLLNIAAHMAYDLGLPVLYVDTEMSTEEQQTRLLSHVSQVKERTIISGEFCRDERDATRVAHGYEKISNGLFLHKYYPGYTIDGLKSLVRKYKARHDIAAFFFDYIKIPEMTSDIKENQALGNVTTALKDLAGSLSIPAISAAQIKRGEGAPKSFFHDSDVADSDKIGRYCNNLFALARKTPKEIEEGGRDEYGNPLCGTHRLQILLARGGGQNYKGIDLHYYPSRLTIVQANNQSNDAEDDFEGL